MAFNHSANLHKKCTSLVDQLEQLSRNLVPAITAVSSQINETQYIKRHALGNKILSDSARKVTGSKVTIAQFQLSAAQKKSILAALKAESESFEYLINDQKNVLDILANGPSSTT
jgi:hypothetical protein